MLADDAVNVFLFLLPKTGVWNAKLTGLWENVPIPVNDLTEVAWTSDPLAARLRRVSGAAGGPDIVTMACQGRSS